MTEESKPSIRFQFIKSTDYKQVYVNGAIGVVSPKNELVCDLYYEYPEFPTEQEFELTKEGKLGSLLSKKPESESMIRELRVGLTMNLEHAERIAKWLLVQIKEARGEKLE